MDARVGTLVLVCAAAYSLAGIPVGLLIVRATRPGLDLRRVGTGNVGTSNVFRNVGLGVAAVVGPLQFLQGLGPVLLARMLGVSDEGLAAVAVCAVAGSAFSPYLRFNGGRAVAVATGAVAGLGGAGLITLLLCYALGLAAGEIAAGVMAGFVVLPVIEAVVAGAATSAGAGLILAVLASRRLEGVNEDLRSGPVAGILLRRLVRDERPGQTLVGRRMDP